MKIGYLGPKGSFTEAAAHKYIGENASDVEMICCPSLANIVSRVESLQLDRGIVPLENSIEGGVNQILDLVAKSEVIRFCGEVIIKIRHCLLVKPGTGKNQIKKVLSHPQALAQCRKYLDRELPGHLLEETPSTSQAVKTVACGNGDMAAIGTEISAGIYGLEIVDCGIQDSDENLTRFIVLAREDCEYSPNSKTSLIVEAKDRPGALYSILREFALREINLTKIESRPIKKKLGQYRFFIDLEGHRRDPEIDGVIDNLISKMNYIRVLGSYPKDESLDSKDPTEKKTAPISIEEMRAEIDLMDSQIVDLIGMRTNMVRKIGSLKGEVNKIRDPAREKIVIDRVREIAVKKKVDPDIIERVYSTIVEYSVELQKKGLELNK
ncbi:MAG: prephenate dehydratase [Peptococcaceae bacterium]|nr:prephenate dehydratase [Peptococcaceae bacterium]